MDSEEKIVSELTWDTTPEVGISIVGASLELAERARLAKTSKRTREILARTPLDCYCFTIAAEDETIWWSLREADDKVTRVTYIDHTEETHVHSGEGLGKFVVGNFVELALTDVATFLVNQKLNINNFYVHIEAKQNIKDRFLSKLRETLSALPQPLNACTFTFCDHLIDAASILNVLPYLRPARLKSIHLSIPPYFGTFRPTLDLEPIQGTLQWRNAENFHTNCLAVPMSCWLDKTIVDVRAHLDDTNVLQMLEHVRQSPNAERIVVVGETSGVSRIETLRAADSTATDGTPMYQMTDRGFMLSVKKSNAQIVFARVPIPEPPRHVPWEIRQRVSDE